MKSKRLAIWFSIICIFLVSSFSSACGPKPGPAPAPAPAPAPTPAPAPAPKPSPSPTAKPTEVISWKLATYSPSGSPYGLTQQFLADEIGKRSSGRISVKVYYGGSLCGATEMLDAGKSGVADIVAVAQSYFPSRLKLGYINYLPFLSPPRIDWSNLTFDEIAKHPAMVEENKRENLVYGFFLDGPAYTLMGNAPVRTVIDLKGKRIRVVGALADLIKKFGAVPVSLAAPDTFSALQSGVVDLVCVVGDYWAHSYKIYEASKYYMPNMAMGGAGCEMLINMDAWKALPEDLRNLTLDFRVGSARECQKNLASRELVDGWRTQFKARGIEFIDFPSSERNKLVGASSDIWQDWIDKSGGESARQLLAAYLTARKKVIETYPEGVK